MSGGTSTARDGGVRLVPVDDASWPVLERLVQLERHDLSEVTGELPDDDGGFADRRIERWRSEPGFEALLVLHDGLPAGFVLTRPFDDGSSFVHSFFVMRGLRRLGVGRRAALDVLRSRPGRWSISFLEENPGASPFWREVVREVAGPAYEESRRTAPDGREFTFLVVDVP